MHEIPEDIVEEIKEFAFDGRRYVGQRIERWIVTGHGGPAACGKDEPITIKSVVGVSRGEEQTLKDYCEFSLGIKDVKSFKAGLENSVRRSVIWSSGEETTISMTLFAPKCGSRDYTVYRKAYFYRLKVWQSRFIRKSVLRDLPEFKELTHHYKAIITDEEGHPACPCPEAEKRGIPARVKILFNDKFTAFVDGVIDSTNRLRFDLGNQDYAVDVRAIAQGEVSQILADVPSYFLHFAGLDDAAEIEVALSATLDGEPAGLLLSLLSGWVTEAGQTPLNT